MSGFMGQTKTMENVPGDIAGLRAGLSDFLLQGGFEGLNTGTPDLQPYKDLFTQQNATNFAQAKEASGNLTGTGYANNLGKAAARADVEQGAFLANLLEQSKQQNSQRLASVLLPFITAGVGAPQQVHQPGFLDYLTSAGAQVAGAAGAAGGFGKLF